MSRGLDQLEGELAGFDEQMFIEEFTRFGGIWLSELGSGYQTYDGEHLEAASAARFSDALAERLGRELSQDR